MYQVVLLDLDNTLLDFDAAEREGFARIVETRGIPFTEGILESYQKINRALWHQLELGTVSKETVLYSRFTTFFKSYGITVDGYQVEMEYRTSLNRSAAVIPHAKETLEQLRSLGTRLFSASNGVYETQMERLKNTALYDFFEGHFISDVIGYEKPSPLFFKHCFQTLKNIDPKSILMVGDSPSSDILGAKQAGIDCCWYRHAPKTKAPEATYAIESLLDLIPIVQNSRP